MILIATVFWVRLSYLDASVSATRSNVSTGREPFENLAKGTLA
jgi:hypothetical protein